MDTLERDIHSVTGWRVGDRELTREDYFEIAIDGNSFVCSLNIGQALCDLGHVDLPLLEGLEARLIRRQVEHLPNASSHGAPVPCMVRKDERGVALALLRRFLNAARSVIVCDAYFFAEGAAELADEFVSILPIGTIQSVEVFYREETHGAIQDFKAALAERNISLQLYPTREVHDRIWIQDETKAMHVGTSFNGLGRRTAFLLELPEEDLLEFLQVLIEIRKGKQPFQHMRSMRAARQQRQGPPRPTLPGKRPE